MNRRRKRKVALLLVMGAVAVGCAFYLRYWDQGRQFNAKAWHDAALVEQGIRLEMADRLIVRAILKGKSRAEVVAMLGEPPPTEYFRNWDLVYWIGPERSFFSIDSEWLVFRLGPDGRVVEYRIVRD